MAKQLLKGHAGFKGKSAYDIAVEMGFEGTKEEWLDSLRDDSLVKVEKQARQEADGNLQNQIKSLASGSPKGSYATVSALTNANPETGVYIVTENGHIYSWIKNGSKAVDLGLYQAAELEDTDKIRLVRTEGIKDVIDFKYNYLWEHGGFTSTGIEQNSSTSVRMKELCYTNENLYVQNLDTHNIRIWINTYNHEGTYITRFSAQINTETLVEQGTYFRIVVEQLNTDKITFTNDKEILSADFFNKGFSMYSENQKNDKEKVLLLKKYIIGSKEKVDPKFLYSYEGGIIGTSGGIFGNICNGIRFQNIEHATEKMYIEKILNYTTYIFFYDINGTYLSRTTCTLNTLTPIEKDSYFRIVIEGSNILSLADKDKIYDSVLFKAFTLKYALPIDNEKQLMEDRKYYYQIIDVSNKNNCFDKKYYHFWEGGFISGGVNTGRFPNFRMRDIAYTNKDLIVSRKVQDGTKPSINYYDAEKNFLTRTFNFYNFAIIPKDSYFRIAVEQDAEEIQSEEQILNSVSFNNLQILEEPLSFDNLPILYLNGDMTDISKDNKVILTAKYIDDFKNKYFKCYCTLKWQGSSSIRYAKKNFTIQLYKNKAVKKKHKKKIEFKDSWGSESKYCLKANFIDHSHARNIVSALLWGDIVDSRKETNSLLDAAPNKGAIDGFPFLMYINNEYQGIYTWNIPKDGWMFNMDEDNINHCVLCAMGNNNGDNTVERDTEFRKNSTLNSSKTAIGHWEVEFPDAATEDLATSLNNLINCIKDTDDSTFKETINNYLDLESAIDYYLFTYFIYAMDNLGQNMILATYDGIKWICSAYDLDSTFGLFWNGTYLLNSDSAFPDDYTETNSLLWKRLEQCFAQEIYNRYKELRETALSIDNIEKRIDIFTKDLTDYLYYKDTLVYTIPSGRISTPEQMKDFIKQRATYVDEKMEELITSNDTE